MADILIRMEMPGSCAACDFYNVISGRCTRTGTKINFSELTTRSVDCPISELPPHGDLIDRDAILNAEKTKPIAKMMMFGGAYVIDLDVVRDAPVVVPAERREGDAPD